MEIIEGNKYVKKIKEFIKENFVNAHTYLYKFIIKNSAIIITNKEININIINDKKLYDKFIKYNNKRIEDNYIVNKLSISIVKFLELYFEDINLPKSGENSFANKYVDCDDFYKSTEDYDETDEINKEYQQTINDNQHLLTEVDVIMPSEETTFQSLLRNLFYNNDVKYAFNNKIEKNNHPDKAVEIKTAKFKIISVGEDVELPTKYEWVCKAETSNGECGRKIEFFQGHLHNNLKCNLNTAEKTGHTIKNPEKIPPKEMRKLYCYYANLVNSDNGEEKEYLTYSLLPIYKEVIECNYIYVGDNKSFIVILGYKYVDDKKNDVENVITKTDELGKWFFAEDIYKNLQTYFKDIHDINITNQNKIIGLFLILQTVCNIFLNHRYHSLLIGTSGSGKTFWKHYIAMFTFNYKVVMGTSITKNKFIGGRSNIISQFKNSLYSPGYIETLNVLICEEATDLLDRLYNPNIPTEDNLLTWIKTVDQGEIDRAIQGSRMCKPHASIVMFGNTENLKFLRSEIIKNLKKVYVRTTNGKTLQNLNTIYHPPEYYVESYNNNDLAKTHAIVREEFYKNHHYITGMPEAEMSRFTFFICLEDDEHGYTRKVMTSLKQPVINYHRYELIRDLNEKWKNISKPNKKMVKDIWNYLNDYMEKERNNYRFTDEKDVNTHVFENVANMIIDVIYLNKLWYELPEEFTEDDKRLIKFILSYNYNTLSKFEANLSISPKMNDCFFNVEDIRQQVEDDKTRFKQMLSQQKQDEEDNKIILDEDGRDNTDIFNELPPEE